MTAVRTGLERLALGDDAVVRLVRGRDVGLVAHPASVTRAFVPALDVLRASGAHVRALFGPEHGFAGEAQDMIAVGDANEPAAIGEEAPSAETGVDRIRDKSPSPPRGEGRGEGRRIPIHTLYGATFDSLSPTRAQLDGLDALVIDLQDVGSRYYTFVWTAALCLRAAANAGVHTIVLDRPNPLGGVVTEGDPQDSGYLSFVGLYPVPVRHAKTIGEIVSLAREVESIAPEALTVVEMLGWRRDMLFPETGLPWVLPSPNMPTFDTALVYPGGCLLEGTLLSEGRGTTRPFEIWGQPGLDGRKLAERVTALGHPGIHLRPLSFQPTFHKHAGQLCGGVQVHVTEPSTARTYAAYRDMIRIARDLLGDRFAWRTAPYEFVADRPAIDLLTGSARFRLEAR